MQTRNTGTAVVVDAEGRYLGILSQQQLAGLDGNCCVDTLTLAADPHFDETTSIWDAMQAMRTHMGEAIALVDSGSGRYLGAIPESSVIDAYLDASEKLRREEHEI